MIGNIWYGHFDSDPRDMREMFASDWARYIHSMVSDGIRNGGTCLQVTAAGGNAVSMDGGTACIQGYIFMNDPENKGLLYNLPAPEPHPSLSRIDRVVLKLNRQIAYRTIIPEFKLGVAASSPIPPELERGNEIWELSLARIVRKPGAVSILPEDITDERMDDTVCGLMNSVLGLDSSAWQKQFDDFLASIKALDTVFLIEQQKRFDESLEAQRLEYITEYNKLMALYYTLSNDITKLQSFDFDNLMALEKVKRTTTRSADGKTTEEVITSLLTGLKIAERITVRTGANNSNETVRVYATDGVSIFKRGTTTTERPSSGTTIEITDGYSDYALSAAYLSGRIDGGNF